MKLSPAATAGPSVPPVRPGGAAASVEACPSGGWPPRPRRPRRGSKLRIQPAASVGSLSRPEDGVRAALALSAAYRGERTIAISLGGIRAVADSAVAKLVREACWLVHDWGGEARIELRCLRPSVRRVLIAWLPRQADVTAVATGRRTIVLVPAADAAPLHDDALESLGATRRKMVRLAQRDGGHCVWCRTPLTHRSAHATVDHVRCRCDGGGNAIDNLVLACSACNHRRSNAPAELWLATCLDAGAPVDADAVREAIRRSERHHRSRAPLAA